VVNGNSKPPNHDYITPFVGVLSGCKMKLHLFFCSTLQIFFTFFKTLVGKQVTVELKNESVQLFLSPSRLGFGMYSRVQVACTARRPNKTD
jgi:hypothetical protein